MKIYMQASVEDIKEAAEYANAKVKFLPKQNTCEVIEIEYPQRLFQLGRMLGVLEITNSQTK